VESLALVMVPSIVPGMITLKVTALLAWPETVTTMGPAVALAGTFVTMLVLLQVVSAGWA
jgi:hypothetical protein